VIRHTNQPPRNRDRQEKDREKAARENERPTPWNPLGDLGVLAVSFLLTNEETEANLILPCSNCQHSHILQMQRQSSYIDFLFCSSCSKAT